VDDELVGCEAAQGLEPTGMIVGIDEELQVLSKLSVTVVVEAFVWSRL
jgi:hypothetical protein